MGQVESSLAGAFLLALGVAELILIYFLSREGYNAKLTVIEKLGIAGVPNPDFFRFVWPLFIFTSFVGYYLASAVPGVLWRWGLVLVLTFLEAFFLFGTLGFGLFPLALVVAAFMVIILGESIYYLAVTVRNKAAAALFGFYFLWQNYALYFIFAVTMKLLNDC
jgi:tryptophan-rich sensory protein